MRTDQVWYLVAYMAIVGSVCGVVWLWHRQRDALVRDLGERTVAFTPIPAPRHSIEARLTGTTVYWSREALKDSIIREYDASRTTVTQRPARLDRDLLQRVASVARTIGQNDWLLMQNQDHEPDMSQDLDTSRCGPLRIIKNEPENQQVAERADAN